MQDSCYLNAQELGSVGGKLTPLPENSTSDTPSSHKFVANFVQFLLKGTPMTVVDAPHTCLHNFLRWQARFISHNEMQLVADKETDGIGYQFEPSYHQYTRGLLFEQSKFLR